MENNDFTMISSVSAQWLYNEYPMKDKDTAMISTHAVQWSYNKY